MDFVFLLKALLNKKWIIIGVTILAAVLAILFTIDDKRVYRSTAQLASGFTVNDPLENSRYNVFEVKVKFSNLIATLNSTSVINLLSYSLILHDLKSETPFKQIKNEENLEKIKNINLPEIIEGFEEKLLNLENISTYDEKDKQLLDILKIYEYQGSVLRKNLLIFREGQTDYVTISYISTNPELSAYVVNTLCKEFLRYYNTIQFERSEESIKTFEKLVDQKRKLLEVKSSSLEQFKSSQGVVNFDLESESKIEQIAKAESALSEEKQNINRLTFSLNDVNKRLAEVVGAISGSDYSGNNDNNSNSELLELQERIRKVNQEYVSSGMSNKRLLDSLNSLRSKRLILLNSNNIQQLPKNELIEKRTDLIDKKNELETELAIAQQNESSIISTINLLKNNVGTYASKEARIAALQREVELATQEYQNAQEKYNAALDLSIGSSNKIKQLLFGQPAIEPEPSKRIIITALSASTSFVLSVLIIIFLTYIDLSIKNPSNFLKLTNLEPIGIVNQLPLNKSSSIKDIFFNSNPLDKNGLIFRELMRKLRFVIETSNQKVFLFSSNKKSEGKSTLIYSLSCALSLSKNKVLIIDTNFAHNSLTQKCNAISSLEKLVTTDNLKLADLMRGVTPTDIPGVDAIGCKGGSYSPSEVFPHKNFKEYLGLLKEKYDVIFMEGGGLNHFSDSKELALYADSVISVFSARSSIKQTDKESINYFQSLGSKYAGAVLNQVELEDIDQ